MNPFKPHASNLFADRDTVEQALTYAHGLINALTPADKPAALTALMVVVNTAAKLWPETEGQQQVTVTLSREELDQLVVTQAQAQVKAYLPSLINEWADENFSTRADEWLDSEADLSSDISNWFHDNVDIDDAVKSGMDDWADDNLDDRIETWVENNLDIEDKVREELEGKVESTVRDVLINQVSVRIEL